jgi:Ser/Thr protein kinase RdoA (MazF antagonist)
VGLDPPFAALSEVFALEGRLLTAQPYGKGHINSTYLAEYDSAGRRTRFIIQKLNQRVFKEPALVMDNLRRLTEHLPSKAQADPSRRPLRLRYTRTGKTHHHTENGLLWRVFPFIKEGVSLQRVSSPGLAVETGRAFGRFQLDLLDLPGPPLAETIPDFHHLPKRFADFTAALETDPLNRARTAPTEIDFALQQASWLKTLFDLEESGAIPRRIAHNDCKISNLLFNPQGEAITVLDLDTTMPGLWLTDFGDMMRSVLAQAEPSQRLSLFAGLTQGYLSQTAPHLTATERDSLVLAGQSIALELGLRFLTDYLLGDSYFSIDHPQHNLARTQAQFRLTRWLQSQRHQLEKVVAWKKPTFGLK